MSRKTPQKTYTAEFRREAVKMIQEQQLSYRAAADKLGVPEGTLAGWVNRSSVMFKEAAKPGEQSAEALRVENARLRKELAEARMERDILKKATAYFAKGSL